MNHYVVGENIGRYRDKLNLSQEELAELAGIHRVTLARYETGRTEPGAQHLARIADALNVSVDVLLGRDTPENEIGDTWAIRERLRRDQNYRLLFDAADNATPEHLRAAAAMLKALEGTKTE